MSRVTAGRSGQVLGTVPSPHSGNERTVFQTVFADQVTIAIILLDEEGRMEQRASVNPPEESGKLGYDEVWMRTWEPGCDILLPKLFALGVFEDTGRVISSGFVEGPVWRLLKEPWRPSPQA